MIFNIDLGMKNVTPSLNTQYPADVSVLAGNRASFTVFVTDEGFPKDHVLQWFVNGVAVPGATEPSYVRDTSGDKGKLSVWCEVTNKAGTTTSRIATLTVKKLTTLDTMHPSDTSTYVGFVPTFIIATTEFGYPASYTCQWYVNGVAVPGATGTSFQHYRTISGTDSVYCEVTNDAGTVRSRTATLKAEPLFLYNRGNTYDAFSGGWVEALTSSSSRTHMELNSNHILITGKTNEYDGGCGTAASFDLSKQTRLNAIAYTSDPSNRSCMYVTTQLNNIDLNAVAAMVLPTTTQVISLDITNINAGHIAFSAHGGEASHSSEIIAVWLG